MHIDLFCKVVDNFGDAGVCWRLARHLTNTLGHPVRLWIDDLACLARLWPGIDTAQNEQECAGVRVRRWAGDLADVECPEVVIEAFACELPEAYLAAMAARPRAPVWINLEYLSAERWVEGCHALPSPHPRLPLTCHFYFPGFTAGTGGVPGEHDLLRRRDEFRADAAGIRRFWRETIGIDTPGDRARIVSMFAYDNPALGEFVAAWQTSAVPVHVLVPARSRTSVLAAFGLGQTAGSHAQSGALTARVIPFLSQDDYDRLLWACDVNFVRGEDSFVRALWTGAPFVWQAYPQTEDAHHAKVEAFLAHYLDRMAPDAAAACAAIHRQWNGMERYDTGRFWDDFLATAPALALHANRWAETALGHGVLAENLASFCRSTLKS